MKAILEFDLPTERMEYDHCRNGLAYLSIIEAILKRLREMRKYENKKSITITELEELIINAMRKRNLA